MKGDSLMKMRFTVLLLVLWAGTAFAGPATTMGGKEIPVGTSHQVGVGWPSLFYEWWHSGMPDWAIGGEVVYGDWSGGFSDVKIGGAVNVPLRFHLSKMGSADIAFQVKPGFLLGSMEVGRKDRFVCGLRSELSLPVSIELTPKVNLITGGAIPLSVFFVDGADDYVVLPFLVRLGAEVKATETITPWLVFELGPAMAFGDGTETEFAFRIWAGSAFW
jgi:hypothetical protein